jgi:hypothetical protein
MNYHTVFWTIIEAHLKPKQNQNFLGDIYHKTRFHFVKIHNSCVCACVSVLVCVCVTIPGGETAMYRLRNIMAFAL